VTTGGRLAASPHTAPSPPVHHEAGFEVATNEPQQPLGGAAFLQPPPQHLVMDAGKELFFPSPTSTTTRWPSGIYCCASHTAWGACRPGRKPWLCSENVGSNRGCRAWRMRCWMTRASAEGIPSLQTPPPLFGISTASSESFSCLVIWRLAPSSLTLGSLALPFGPSCRSSLPAWDRLPRALLWPRLPARSAPLRRVAPSGARRARPRYEP
jgi:hypothetical protein